LGRRSQAFRVGVRKHSGQAVISIQAGAGRRKYSGRRRRSQAFGQTEALASIRAGEGARKHLGQVFVSI
jgi:hypothetical protein